MMWGQDVLRLVDLVGLIVFLEDVKELDQVQKKRFLLARVPPARETREGVCVCGDTAVHTLFYCTLVPVPSGRR